jgi:hypothetical protein
MRIIVDAPRYYKAIFKYLDKIFEGGYISDKNNSRYFLNSDKKVLAAYHKEYDTIYINTNELWFKFERIFSLNYKNLETIFKNWFKNRIPFFRRILGFSVKPTLPPEELSWTNMEFDNLKPIQN